ncbi:CRISPR-associated endoribonuclease Cas6 [Effusibacillus pohliae]|uniref:CRISPR-associated endoribonuclease Cas6 n=1 Tax=Effusibacillus pohliae TaxID=232270 RepID=UPI00037D0F8D|nr:CRISPR-associated endoribonuclease Cas6 [Effusibacillus pohliae]
MRITACFKTDKLPFAYRLGVLSIIKECLKKGDSGLYKSYFQTNRPKPYAFSVYLHDFRFQETEISLSGFDLHITSPDYQFIIPFLNGLQKTTQFRYKQYLFHRGSIRFGNEQKVHSSRILVRTLSPILIENERHQPLSPHDPAYNDQFLAISNRISQSLRGQSLKSFVKITPVSTKKVVIKELNDSYLKAREEQRVSSDYLFFTAYQGRFMLEGDPSDLQWLVDVGCGLRTGQGFGYIQVESE